MVKRTKTPEPGEYLSKEFDYTKLTKDQLRKILSEQGVTVMENKLKTELLQMYKNTIHDKIDEIKKKMGNVKADSKGIEVVESDANNFSTENPFQSPKKNEKKEGDLGRRTPVRNLNVEKESDFRTPARIRNIYNSFDVPKAASERKARRVSLVGSETVNEERDSSLLYRTAKESIKRHLDRQGLSHAQDKTPTKSPVRGVHKTLFSPSDVRQPVSVRERSRGHSLRIFSVIFLPLFAVFFFYLKCLVPYCTDGKKCCIRLPKNTFLDEKGQLRCSRGYMLQKNLLFPNKAVRDISQSDNPDEIVRYLRKTSTEFYYGLRRSKLIKLSINEELKRRILGYGDVRTTDNLMFFSKKRIFSPSILIKSLYNRHFYTMVFAVFAIVVIFYVINFYKQLRIKGNYDKVVDMLRLQKKNSTRFQVNPFLFEEQIVGHSGLQPQDFLNVKRLLEMNTNVTIFNMSVSGRSAKAYEWLGEIGTS
ncbi:hypothetical protein VCUG_01963 [Vavraia culicis subsp. floridensis]|uniref:Man1/Src1 C-terminal domain-containing protein n=1 Tax=Vavraia culicis (isolate floridensis) TaxID=948595 RepID=L2GTW0_VAVCU|nr:uncharacterized protein VCUG_01963 [Vavraia culicis subsp. floridensis]ELA46530.1 hypothetical protein VCUG_01963 [Vavraia culicis subsp. floridensis]